MILRKKSYDKYYYIKKGKKKKYYYICNINLEKNIKDIYNFLIKYLNDNNIIMEVSNDYHDDKCLIEEYDIFERKYNKGGNKFNYIYNDEYRRQLALISIEKKDFDLSFFKEICKLFSGVKMFIDLNILDYNNFLKLYKQRKFRNSEKYDKFTLAEDSLYIEVKKIDDYTNLDRDIEEFVLIKSNENKKKDISIFQRVLNFFKN